MFIKLHVQQRDGCFEIKYVNSNLIFTIDWNNEEKVTELFTSVSPAHFTIKETPEEIMQLIKEASK